mgnify:CR=1 FL=1
MTCSICFLLCIFSCLTNLNTRIKSIYVKSPFDTTQYNEIFSIIKMWMDGIKGLFYRKKWKDNQPAQGIGQEDKSSQEEKGGPAARQHQELPRLC